MISISYVIGMAAFVLLVAATTAGVAWGVRTIRRGGEDDRFIGGMAAGLSGLCLVGVLVFGIGGLWPMFDMQYHSYRSVSGAVDQIQARMLGDGSGGTTQMFAVRFRGDATMYRCDDSRCSLLKAGDRLWLRCIREWQYAAEDGWKCNYVRSEQAA